MPKNWGGFFFCCNYCTRLGNSHQHHSSSYENPGSYNCLRATFLSTRSDDLRNKYCTTSHYTSLPYHCILFGSWIKFTPDKNSLRMKSTQFSKKLKRKGKKEILLFADAHSGIAHLLIAYTNIVAQHSSTFLTCPLCFAILMLLRSSGIRHFYSLLAFQSRH